MTYDDGSQFRHVGKTAGLAARERLLIVAAVGLIASAIVLSAAVDDERRVGPTPDPSQLAIGPTGSPVATPTAAPTPRPVPTPRPPRFECVVPAGPSAVDPWRAFPCEHRGQDDAAFEYDCPPGGEAGPVWGDVVYTDDSSVCGAAVHAGVLAPGDGGTVTVVVRPGRAGYVGTARNGVTSSAWDGWGGSFEVVGSATRLARGCPPAFDFPSGDGWLMTPCIYRGDGGRELEFACPQGGAPGPIWGHQIYTDDSSVCTAAVHAGALTVEEGGIARVAIRPGRDSYGGSTQNGITSQAWDGWGGSFEVVMPQTGAARLTPPDPA